MPQTLIEDRHFKDEPIVIDNTKFYNCNFERCVLIFTGMGPPTFDTCVFDAPQLSFQGAAGNTLGFMTTLYHSPFKPFIEKAFQNIIAGAPSMHHGRDKAQKPKEGE